jgi:hypothetical protein
MEEKMVKIKQNLKVAQDRKKSYADKGRHIENSEWVSMCF